MANFINYLKGIGNKNKPSEVRKQIRTPKKSAGKSQKPDNSKKAKSSGDEGSDEEISLHSDDEEPQQKEIELSFMSQEIPAGPRGKSKATELELDLMSQEIPSGPKPAAKSTATKAKSTAKRASTKKATTPRKAELELMSQEIPAGPKRGTKSNSKTKKAKPAPKRTAAKKSASSKKKLELEEDSDSSLASDSEDEASVSKKRQLELEAMSQEIPSGPSLVKRSREQLKAPKTPDSTRKPPRKRQKNF